jgi:hypothetical protein
MSRFSKPENERMFQMARMPKPQKKGTPVVSESNPFADEPTVDVNPGDLTDPVTGAKTRKPRTPLAERIGALSTVEKSVFYAKKSRALKAELADLAALVGKRAVELAEETDS